MDAIARRLVLWVAAGVFLVSAAPLPNATGAEYRFVARSPSTDHPIWEPVSDVIDLSQVPKEDIVLVLENPTDTAHAFVMPQLRLVTHERVITPVESMVPADTVVQYTAPVRVTVEPGTVSRIRLSDGGFKARQDYSETIVFFCPLHKSSKAGSVSFVK
ncbi:hypothetical protein [Candidatus Nitrospira bockiana]